MCFGATSWERATQAGSADRQGCVVQKRSQDRELIPVVKCHPAGKTNGFSSSPALCFSLLFAWSRCRKAAQRRGSWENRQRSVQLSRNKEEKLHFPSAIPAARNAGNVPVTAGFQSTLKCNWTLEHQTEKGRHCQGQSLAWHVIATSTLIDLYKAPTTTTTPPLLPFCLIDLGYSLSKNWMTEQDTAAASSVLFSNFLKRPEKAICQKSIR